MRSEFHRFLGEFFTPGILYLLMNSPKKRLSVEILSAGRLEVDEVESSGEDSTGLPGSSGSVGF